MNIQQPKIDLKNKFELYLEGVRVDFSSMTISEVEGGIPAASIYFASNYNALRILPGTIVQIFGYVHKSQSMLLLFEGEITAINLQKTDQTKVVSVKAISLLGAMIKAKFIPSDAIMTQEYKDATGIQTHNTIIINEKGSDSSVGYQTIEELSNIKNKKPSVLKGRVKDFAITALYGLTDEFKKLLAPDTPGGKGDFIPMLQAFNAQFENNDLFYGLKSLAYKFGRSIFASPNPDLLKKIKVDLFIESFNEIKGAGISGIFNEAHYTLMQVLIEFQRYLHYDFIAPAAYTACMPFYINTIPTRAEPLRMIYLPRLETGPPALCNIIFPEQVSSMTYSREMMEEPTRIVGRATVGFLNKSKTANIDFSPCITYPELDMEEGKAIANFTREETFRGINYKVISYSNLQTDLIIDKTTKNDNGKKTSVGEEPNELKVKGDIGNLLKPFTYHDFMDMKFKTRTTSINTEWSPYRIIGLPALLLDEVGISIFGILHQIETTISANGGAVSRLVLRNTRIIFDEDFGETDFSKIPSKNTVGFEKYIIHDLTNDGLAAVNEAMFYKNLYSFENIGKDVYTYIIQGTLSRNNGFYQASIDTGVFDYTEDKLNPKNTTIPRDEKVDNSILHFLRNSDGNLELDIPEVYNVKEEIRNTYLLYKAINKLRQIYKAKKIKKIDGKEEYDMDQAYTFMSIINKRNIITKEDYFNFIGANPNRKLQTEDAHDAQTIFGKGVSKLREEIQNNAKQQYSFIVSSSNAERMILNTRVKKEREKLFDLPHYQNSAGQKNSQEEIVTAIMAVGKYTEKYVIENILPKVLADIKEQEKIVEDLEININNIKTSTTEVGKNYYEELYKPYNMTRRIHIMLAFKGHSDLVIDNAVSKLRVIK